MKDRCVMLLTIDSDIYHISNGAQSVESAFSLCA